MKGLSLWGSLALCVPLPRDLTWLWGVHWVCLSRAGVAEIHANCGAQVSRPPELGQFAPKATDKLKRKSDLGALSALGKSSWMEKVQVGRGYASPGLC